MTINPRDYDLNELRGVSGEGGNGMDFEFGQAGADDLLRSNQHRELMMLEAATDGLEKPYLSTMPGAFAAEVLAFEWLEYLVSVVGLRGAIEAVGYYASVGWITDDVESALREYLRGIPGEGREGTLDVDDHVTSLLYIAQLSAME